MTVADDAYRATRQLMASATFPAQTQGREDGTRDLAQEYFLRMTGGNASDKECVIRIGPGPSSPTHL